MIQKIKKNSLLCSIVLILMGLGAKNIVSAIQVAEVLNTRYEIYLVMGNTRTSYTYRTIQFRRYYTSYITSERRDYGINPGVLYTYHYNTY
ncbi:hypothetical protein GCM10011510_12160 [Streptococcus himalayensis]|uniref:Uncharacterized protein n=1 Tax=Streptococcus himalayensis TaxID=1888195 RepID=A0A917EEZ0_9STRE|nr:hypothetical protein [Streptococcus himalayensis]GGE32428.1 hypothetical protein GCM10011510_12160 [Streptococcus himalayensis]